MVEKEFIAKVNELPNVISFIESELEKFEFSFKIITQFNLVVEELFVNVASYAYKDKNDGKCKITIDYNQDKQEVKLSMEDNGIKFNPLEKEEPDITLSAEEREIGGLGILLVKKNMDNIEYKYEDNKNILILSKNIK